MVAMTLATLGWGVWWISLLLLRFWPAYAPSLTTTQSLGFLFAGPGSLAGLLCLRARKSWVLLAGVALFANGSLFLMPSLAGELFQ